MSLHYLRVSVILSMVIGAAAVTAAAERPNVVIFLADDLGWGDLPLPTDRTIDGACMLPLFADCPIKRTQPLYWRNHLAPQQYKVGLRVGSWKIVGSDDLSRFELYNLAEDAHETTDLSTRNPEKFDELKQMLVEHDGAVLREGPDWWKHEPPAKKKGATSPANRTKTDGR